VIRWPFIFSVALLTVVAVMVVMVVTPVLVFLPLKNIFKKIIQSHAFPPNQRIFIECRQKAQPSS
jgi:hypothetical protein